MHRRKLLFFRDIIPNIGAPATKAPFKGDLGVVEKKEAAKPQPFEKPNTTALSSNHLLRSKTTSLPPTTTIGKQNHPDKNMERYIANHTALYKLQMPGRARHYVNINQIPYLRAFKGDTCKHKQLHIHRHLHLRDVL